MEKLAKKGVIKMVYELENEDYLTLTEYENFFLSLPLKDQEILNKRRL